MFATSRNVAAFFGKNHRDVLRAIEDLLSVGISIERNFAPIELPTKVGFGTRMDRAYEMDRDGFTLLAMGFTGARALQFKLRYIAAFNETLKRLQELEEKRPRVSPSTRPLPPPPRSPCPASKSLT